METNNPLFKDATTQAVEILLKRFQEQNRLASVSVHWIDNECGLADINNGMLTIQYSDLVVAVRKSIPLGELIDWMDYNARICNVGLEGYTIPIDKWMNYSTVKLSELTIGHLEETYAAMNATKKQYMNLLTEATKTLINI